MPLCAHRNRNFRTGGQFCAVLQNEVSEDWCDERAIFPPCPSDGPPTLLEAARLRAAKLEYQLRLGMRLHAHETESRAWRMSHTNWMADVSGEVEQLSILAPTLTLKRPPSVDRLALVELIRQSTEGNSDAFGQLYELHKRHVYSLCLRMSANVSDAEDLTQDTFLQVHRKLNTFRGEAAFATWLHRLALNIILKHLQKKRGNEVPLQTLTSENGVDGRTWEPVTQDWVLTESLNRIALENALASLAPGYETIFILHDIEGYEHNEIAEMLSCTTGSSKAQLFKARIKLRNWFQRERKAFNGISNYKKCSEVTANYADGLN